MTLYCVIGCQGGILAVAEVYTTLHDAQQRAAAIARNWELPLRDNNKAGIQKWHDEDNDLWIVERILNCPEEAHAELIEHG